MKPSTSANEAITDETISIQEAKQAAGGELGRLAKDDLHDSYYGSLKGEKSDCGQSACFWTRTG